MRLVLFAALAAPALAQSPYATYEGVEPLDQFGISVDGGGDANLDGVPDIVAGGPRASLPGQPSAGIVRVFSGLDGSVLIERVGDAGAGYGRRVRWLGDVNNDGLDDFGVTADLSSDVEVRSGLDGSLIWSVIGFTEVLHGVGDQDGDGFDDFLTMWAGFAGNFSAVWSGQTGAMSTLYNGDRGAGVGDTTFDGLGEIASVSWGGELELYLGGGGFSALLWSMPLVIDTQVLLLESAGDVDGDGRDDILVGDLSTVRVHSGLDGAVLREHPAAVDYFAHSGARGVGDANGDGRDDYLLLGVLVSGADGSTLCDFTLGQPTQGVAGAPAGDLNGDGLPEVLVSRPSGGAASGGGAVLAFRVSGHLGTNYCVSTPNTTGVAATLRAAGSASLAANDLTFVADDLPSNEFGLVFYGGGQTQNPVGNGFVCVGNSGTGLHRLQPVAANGAGFLVFPVDYGALPPGGAIAAGQTWNFQCWYRDPLGNPSTFDFSDGLSIAFVP
jgi:hypothetical protein